jgi:hypothetical protein
LRGKFKFYCYEALLRLLDINKPSRQLVSTAIFNFREYGYFGDNFKLMVTNLNIYYLNKAVILNLNMAAREIILTYLVIIINIY